MMYELKIIFRQKLSFILTILGITLCAILMLFLLSVYKGVEVGSVEYVRANKADLWVLQRHAANILRASSILRTNTGKSLEKIKGVKETFPILFIMAAAQTPEGPATLYLTGYDPEKGRGGPPRIVKGRPIAKDFQIVLDRSFAKKYGLDIGDRLPINKDTFQVVGLSAGTNMFVIQYAFITLPSAYSIVGFGSIATCFQVELEPGADRQAVAREMRRRYRGIAVFDQETFLENNIREMESGLLPLLYVVALISAVVLTAILSLILTVSVLERRKDFAIMKAIGAPKGFIPAMIVKQGLILALAGLLLAFILFSPLSALVEYWSPEVSTLTTAWHLLAVALGVLVISLVSLIIPNRRLRNIYPLEVFK